MATTEHEYVTSRGEAAGKLLRFSHLVFVTRDMDATVRFYRDVLGFQVASTRLADVTFQGERRRVREYFFEIPCGEAFGFYEIPESPDGRTTAPLTGWFWPGTEDQVVERPHKLDHMAFHVESKEDVDFFCNRLTEHGVPYLGPFVARATGFTQRIYFYDPSGNPLELATLTEDHLERVAADPTTIWATTTRCRRCSPRPTRRATMAAPNEATGRITRLSHVNMVNRDTDKSVRFYRDVLGLKVTATTGTEAGKKRDAIDAKDPRFAQVARPRPFTRIYWFEPQSTEGYGFYETPTGVDGRETLPLGSWWPGAEGATAPAAPHKLDHLAFAVAGTEDVDWFKGHLAAHGVEFTGPFEPGSEGAPPARYCYGLYFWDPDGIPVAIVARTGGEAGLDDPEPVSALRE